VLYEKYRLVCISHAALLTQHTLLTYILTKFSQKAMVFVVLVIIFTVQKLI